MPTWARAGAALIAALALLAVACTRSAAPPARPVEAAFAPPPLSALPAGPEGEAIKRGMAIFDNPRVNAAAYVGNAMACRNCHLDGGRAANSAPMWAAWVSYPQFRKKTGTINTIEDRIRQCFLYSMNAPNSPSGGPPPADSDVVRDLDSYFHWLATGAPTGRKLPGAGYPTPPLPAGGYDPARGAALFQAKCSGCHGADGQGAIAPDGTVTYPPLWGPKSYNWGAGMARIDLAAGFIKANMPLGQGGTLTGDEAWHLAAFVDSHERPKDPRQTGTLAANARANFAGQKSYYGQTLAGVTLGGGIAPQR
ncbi:c-type cytochrome [Sphingomonas sp. ASV193]|uniref:c-type cytochrome n=1 Tax=Sphingomonas sp. ASV193 TaxID=3144405 RepID=UPI0032E8A470